MFWNKFLPAKHITASKWRPWVEFSALFSHPCLALTVLSFLLLSFFSFKISLILYQTGPVLALVFSPNNSAKDTHLNSMFRPKVMVLTTGEKVWESQDLLCQYNWEPSHIPRRCFHFRFSNSTFKFPTDSLFYSWHFLAFLFGSATSRTSLSSV